MNIADYIIGIDVGSKGGVAVYKTREKKFIFTDTPSFCNSKKDKSLINGLFIENYFNELFKLSGTIIAVIGEAFGQRAVVKKHSKFYGIIEKCCEEHKVILLYVTDNSARLAVLGKGNGRNKEMVHEKYKGKTPDVSDAMLFVDWYLIRTSSV